MKTGKNIFKWLHNWMKKKNQGWHWIFSPMVLETESTFCQTLLPSSAALTSWNYLPLLWLFYSSWIVYLYVCIDTSIYLSINLFIYIFISQGLRIYLNQAFKENLHLYLFPRKVTHITNKSNTWTDQWQQLWTPHAPGGGALRPHL